MVTGLTNTRRVLYTLKKKFGSSADLYHFVSATDDPSTGQSLVTKVKYRIKRVILLPVVMMAEMNLQGGFRKVDTSVPGALVSSETRLIIIDENDLPNGITVTGNDYFIVRDNRFNVQKTQTLENDVGILVTAQFILGGQRNEFFDVNVAESLTLQEALT